MSTRNYIYNLTYKVYLIKIMDILSKLPVRIAFMAGIGINSSTLVVFSQS